MRREAHPLARGVRGLGCLKELAPCEGVEDDGLNSRTIDELWDQVSQNGARLLELQAQQRKLFKELRALKAEDEAAMGPGAAAAPLVAA